MRRLLPTMLSLVVVLLLSGTSVALSVDQSSQSTGKAKGQAVAQPDSSETGKCKNKKNSRECKRRTSGCSKQGLKSPSSTAPVTISFVNKTDQTLRIEWFNLEGALEPYGDVAPGAQFDQETFVGHIWKLTGPAGECVRIATAKAPTTKAPSTVVTVEG